MKTARARKVIKRYFLLKTTEYLNEIESGKKSFNRISKNEVFFCGFIILKYVTLFFSGEYAAESNSNIFAMRSSIQILSFEICSD